MCILKVYRILIRHFLGLLESGTILLRSAGLVKLTTSMRTFPIGLQAMLLSSAHPAQSLGLIWSQGWCPMSSGE
jgi:hypothetical protein